MFRQLRITLARALLPGGALLMTHPKNHCCIRRYVDMERYAKVVADAPAATWREVLRAGSETRLSHIEKLYEMLSATTTVDPTYPATDFQKRLDWAIGEARRELRR